MRGEQKFNLHVGDNADGEYLQVAMMRRYNFPTITHSCKKHERIYYFSGNFDKVEFTDGVAAQKFQ